MRSLLAKSVAALALAATLVAGSILPANAATGPAGQVVTMTNQQRISNGLPALLSDPTLDAAAKKWAEQLAATGTFQHSTSQWRASAISGAGWGSSGENIAAGYPTATAVMGGWMNSPGHKANILYPQYTGLGVGYATGGPYGYYWVQIFAIGPSPLAAGTVKVTGTPQVGKTLTATASGWPSGTTLRWWWRANGVLITGATKSTYVPTASTIGKTISVKVTGSKPGYVSVSRYSSQTRPVAR